MVTTAANDMMANAAKAAAMAAYDAAKKALADVEADQSADQASYDKAKEQVDAAKDANDKAQAAETAADAQKYRKMAEDANTEAIKYAGMVTVAANKAAAARALAAKIAPAIVDPDGNGEFPETGDLKSSERPGAAATFVVADGGAVTVDSNGATTDTETQYADILDKDDKWDHDNDGATPQRSRANQFQKQTAAPPTLAGFAGSVHERTVDKVTDTLTVYTNVEDAKARAYQMYYSSANEENVSTTAGISGITDNSAGNVIAFETNVSGIHKYIMANAFPNGVKQTYTFRSDDASTRDDDESQGHQGPQKFMGTFHGIPGEFNCGEADGTCSATTDADGNLVTLTDSWIFTPSEAGAKMMVQSVISDDDFLTFGYWLQATEDDDGETTYGVRTFATGAEPFAAVAAIQGSATYSGKATGMYAKKTFNERGVGTPTSSGQFTADTTLTATFGQTTADHPDGAGTVAPNLLNSITGAVSNFMDASGNSIDDAWSVKLNKARISSSNGSIGAEGQTHPATTTGDGSWVGQLYGPTVSDDTGTSANEAVTGYPTGVAGEFNGHFSNGHVIGAFGATKDE